MVGSIPDSFARTVLEMAEAIESEERRIKQALLEAAGNGDLQWIVEALDRWLTGPTTAVLEPPPGRGSGGFPKSPSERKPDSDPGAG